MSESSEQSRKLIEEYWRASERGDWSAAGACVGPDFVWIDHGRGIAARTPEELQESLADDMAWSDLQFEISHVFNAEDGAVIVQGVRSGSITGNWRSIETTGQHVSWEFVDIFKFDADGLIVFQESYYDMAAVLRQLA
jgi:steroid delta-isomerase-like uncharacterized protein